MDEMDKMDEEMPGEPATPPAATGDYKLCIAVRGGQPTKVYAEPLEPEPRAPSEGGMPSSGMLTSGMPAAGKPEGDTMDIEDALKQAYHLYMERTPGPEETDESAAFRAGAEEDGLMAKMPHPMEKY